jgi:hypothetical protein
MKGNPVSELKKLGRWSALPLLLFILTVNTGEAIADRPQRLALLIAAPWEGEVAMHNDLIAMYNALRQRGFLHREILSLEGQLNRRSLISFLQKARGRMATWRQGELLLYFGGHGIYTGTNASESRPGLWLRHDLKQSVKYTMFWDEVFAALNVSADVKVTLLPDT